MCNNDEKLKGVEGKNCNVTACQQPDAVWFNEGTQKYYCRGCAIKIQRSANDYAQRGEEPMVLFKGIFDKDDPRHEVYRNRIRNVN